MPWRAPFRGAHSTAARTWLRLYRKSRVTTGERSVPPMSRMPDIRKEVAGGFAALGLFAGGLAVGIPVVFAGAAAAAAFWAAWTLVPRRRSAADSVLAPRVEQESVDVYVGDCMAAVLRIEISGKAIEGTPIGPRMKELSTLLRRILEDCRKDPSDIRVEPQLPALLEMLASMLERYRDVAPRAD